MKAKKARQRISRKARVRKKIFGTADKPRLTVFRSANHIYAQIIDDTKGATLIAASTVEKGSSNKGNKIEVAKKVGQAIAEKAKSAKIEAVVFDRNGYQYHGRVKALADTAREKGLKF